ncbi:MAG: Mrp/NBP35 family ATP-binding protein [Methanomicrobiales archaeon]|nr:Mrp/NBP35 family ATP-binding protein [Methanomicrobiales archaeon]
MAGKTPNQECNGKCASCATANNCEDPRKAAAGLPEKVNMDVRHVILVLSGKGGVGKSTVAANLAMSLSNRGYNTGLLDLDIHGPSIAKMMGIEDKKLSSLDGKHIDPVRITGTLGVVSMAFLLPDRNTPVIWRGPMKITAIRQFLEDVTWGSLDYLVVDLPPGTGDEVLTVAQLAPNIEGAVIVTTPQDVAVLDSGKAINFVEKIGLRVLGVIENMSGMICPHCGEEIDLFGKGGGKKAAEELGVPFLGGIPMDPEMRKAGDEGRPFIIRKQGSSGENTTWKHVDEVLNNLLGQIQG